MDQTQHVPPAFQKLEHPEHSRPWYSYQWAKWVLVAIGIALIAGAVTFDAVLRNYVGTAELKLSDIEKMSTPLSDAEIKAAPRADGLLSVNLESATAPSFGRADAPITIVQFSDFQCPFCKAQHAIVRSWFDNYPNDVRVIFRNFPIASLHPEAIRASEAAWCAHDQGRFWEFHDALYENQTDLSVAAMKKYAGALKLNQEKFDACVDARDHRLDVEADMKEGLSAGVTSTPTYFINNQKVVGAVPGPLWDQFIAVVLQKLNENRSGSR